VTFTPGSSAELKGLMRVQVCVIKNIFYMGSFFLNACIALGMMQFRVTSALINVSYLAFTAEA
jgi:hypothetical protein